MQPLRTPWRLVATAGLVAHGLWQAGFVLRRVGRERRHAAVQAWSARVLRAMGIELRLSGTPRAGVLMVANHVSWLDITALHAVAPHIRFVSKSAIAHWPLVGTLARVGGTLFIERERKRDALRVVHEVAAALRTGDTVGVFPEGTTGPGETLLPFHANLLQAAITTGTPVQPVVLRYSQPHQAFSEAAQYVGDTTLLGSALRVAGAVGLVVHVEFLDAEATADIDRRGLAARLRERISARLQVPRG